MNERLTAKMMMIALETVQAQLRGEGAQQKKSTLKRAGQLLRFYELWGEGGAFCTTVKRAGAGKGHDRPCSMRAVPGSDRCKVHGGVPPGGVRYGEAGVYVDLLSGRGAYLGRTVGAVIFYPSTIVPVKF